MHFGYTEPRALLRALDDPLLALAAAVVLQAVGECKSSPDAHELLFDPWFDLFSDAIDSEPDRLRAVLSVPDTAPATPAAPIAAHESKPPRTRPKHYRKSSFDERDLIYFCERVPVIGYARSIWRGSKLPSGRQISGKLWRDKLLQPFCKAGIIVDLSNGHGGHLITKDAGEIKRALGLANDAAPEAVPSMSAEMA